MSIETLKQGDTFSVGDCKSDDDCNTVDVIPSGETVKIYVDNELKFELSFDNDGKISGVKNADGQIYNLDITDTPINDLTIASIRYTPQAVHKEVKRIYTMEEAIAASGERNRVTLRYK